MAFTLLSYHLNLKCEHPSPQECLLSFRCRCGPYYGVSCICGPLGDPISQPLLTALHIMHDVAQFGSGCFCLGMNHFVIWECCWFWIAEIQDSWSTFRPEPFQIRGIPLAFDLRSLEPHELDDWGPTGQNSLQKKLHSETPHYCHLNIHHCTKYQ